MRRHLKFIAIWTLERRWYHWGLLTKTVKTTSNQRRFSTTLDTKWLFRTWLCISQINSMRKRLKRCRLHSYHFKNNFSTKCFFYAIFKTLNVFAQLTPKACGVLTIVSLLQFYRESSPATQKLHTLFRFLQPITLRYWLSRAPIQRNLLC